MSPVSGSFFVGRQHNGLSAGIRESAEKLFLGGQGPEGILSGLAARLRQQLGGAFELAVLKFRE